MLRRTGASARTSADEYVREEPARDQLGFVRVLDRLGPPPPPLAAVAGEYEGAYRGEYGL